MTSHRHPPIHPSVAAQREQLHNRAAECAAEALRHETIATALAGCTAPAAQAKAKTAAARGRELRRSARWDLALAADLTDWRDDLDRKAGNWIEPLVALYKATRAAPHPTPKAQAA
jgi:hypothetical protein